MTEAQKKKTLGLAIASLVFGCLFIIPLLGILFSLVAVILGIIALVIISKNKETITGNGLAIAGVVLDGIGLIIMPIIALLAAIAIPNLLRARLNANEAAAEDTLRTISTAAQTFEQVNDRYPGWITELTSAQPPYLNTDYTLSPLQGYNYQYINTNNDSTLLATAVPSDPGVTGTRSFCIAEDGILRSNPDGEDILSYSSCAALEEVGPNKYYPQGS